VVLERHLDSNILWLLGKDEPINLHPLMLITPDEIIGEDIWLYQGISKETVVYKSYGTGRTTDNDKHFQLIRSFLGW